MDTQQQKLEESSNDSIDECEVTIGKFSKISGKHHNFTDAISSDKSGLFGDLARVDWSKVKWAVVFYFVLLHTFSAVALKACLSGSVSIFTILWTVMLVVFSGIGVTMGAHRLWAHKSYKSINPVRIVLMLAHTLVGQESIFTWTIDHRTHHKFTDTDADHTNINRGFFFAHIGHCMLELHPHVVEARTMVDTRDLQADPVVKFQHNYYLILFAILGVIFPVMIPVYFWNETLSSSILVAVVLRLFITYHVTFATGSISHTHGTRPYDSSLKATENVVIGPLSLGEGWHNFHHTFPYDYRASEYNDIGRNPTTAIIDWCATKNWVYDRKTASDSLISARMRRTGSK